MNIEIKHRYTGKVILCGKYESVRECLEKNRGANLRGAYLEGANLRNANLEGTYLEGANLRGAYLEGTYLEGANLRGAYLEGAYLRDAYLRGAYLEGANLRGANLRGANLRDANLEGTYLEGAKNYHNSHDIAQEIIRRQKTEFFTQEEWALIGQILVHRLCWDKMPKESLSISEKLDKLGFGEYLNKFKEPK